MASLDSDAVSAVRVSNQRLCAPSGVFSRTPSRTARPFGGVLKCVMDLGGASLRRTSLDDLLQLFSVILCQMGLVGPRPIVSAEVPRCGAAYEAYAAARPGMTGLCQVSGRSDTDYDRRVALGLVYTQSWSPWRDLSIAARTVIVVLRGSGAR